MLLLLTQVSITFLHTDSLLIALLIVDPTGTGIASIAAEATALLSAVGALNAGSCTFNHAVDIGTRITKILSLLKIAASSSSMAPLDTALPIAIGTTAELVATVSALLGATDMPSSMAPLPTACELSRLK